MRTRLSPIALVFVGLCAFSLIGAIGDVGRLADHGGSGRALVAGYAVLRAVVAAAFTVSVIRREPAQRPVRELRALVACGIAMGALVAIRPPGAADAASLPIAGESVAVVGCAWLLVSALALGRCFGVLPEARGVVTSGPYKLIRHPIYLGELTAAAGLLIAAPTVLNAVFAVAFAGAQAARMTMEETELSRTFPAYAAYAATTPRIIPRSRRSASRVLPINLEY